MTMKDIRIFMMIFLFKNNKILFKTFNGAYTCNPKYIAEEILRQNLPYELVWVVNKDIFEIHK